MEAQACAGNELDRLLRCSNTVAKAFKQPQLYAEELPLLNSAEYQMLDQSDITKLDMQGDVLSTGLTSQRASRDEKRVDRPSQFHISIGWTLKAPSEEMVSMLRIRLKDQAIGFHVSVDTVKVKIGNGIIAVPLLSKVEASGGILGM